MNKFLTLIVGKDQNKENIHLLIFVDDDKNITALNLAGTVLEDELKNLNTPKVPNELYEMMKTGEPIDLTKQYEKMSIDEIKKHFMKKLKG